MLTVSIVFQHLLAKPLVKDIFILCGWDLYLFITCLCPFPLNICNLLVMMQNIYFAMGYMNEWMNTKQSSKMTWKTWKTLHIVLALILNNLKCTDAELLFIPDGCLSLTRHWILTSHQSWINLLMLPVMIFFILWVYGTFAFNTHKQYLELIQCICIYS